MSYIITPGAASSSGSGGTAGLGTFVTPPTTGWTWRNQGAATVTVAADGSALTLSKPAIGANAPSHSLYTRPIPASRRVTAAFRPLVSAAYSSGQFPGAGLCLFDSGSSQFIVPRVVSDSAFGPVVVVDKFTNYTTYNSNYFAPQTHFQNLMWFRMTQPAAAGNRVIEWSLDGLVWLPTPMVNSTYNDFCLPTEFGLSVDSFGFAGNTVFGVQVKLVSWDES
jgi:hypothetical protein